MNIYRRLIRFLALAVLLATGLGAGADPLVIAAGAGYKKPLMEIYAAYVQAGGATVEPVFGNMQQVLAQTRDSGRVALVLGEHKFLLKTGLFERFIPVGTGKLVLAWVGQPRGWQALADADVQRIAMPDPGKAIYGTAAKQFLERSGMMAKVEAKLMVVATVPQASSYVVAKSVDAAFINITDALGIQDHIGGYEAIPQEYYDAPEIVVGIPKGSAEKPGVASFLDFLATPTSQAILKKYGL